MKKILLFNKEGGSLFATFESEGFDVSGIDPELFSYREVEMEDSEFWYGDYETGRVYDNTQIQIVTQQAVRDRTIEKIFEKYFFIDQIKILTDMLKGFVPESDQTQDFRDMVAYIDEARAEYHAKKEAFSSNPDVYIWVSDEDQQEQVNSRYKGIF